MAKVNVKMIKSEFFTLSELTKSATAKKLNIDNTPPADVVENLQYGCDMVLDPLRRLYGGPIVIGSGYRCKQLNKKLVVFQIHGTKRATQLISELKI